VDCRQILIFTATGSIDYTLPNPPQDTANWEAFKSGDRNAFEKIFREMHPGLLQYGTRICPDRELLEDAIQDLFLEIWQSRSNASVLSVKAYLLKALKYKLFRMMKAAPGKNLQTLDEQDIGFSFSHDHLLVQKEEEKIRSHKLQQALETLPARQREIVYLRIYQGLEYAEISEIMAINYQVARNLFYQSMKTLRQYFFEN
jgi:RNA polymerase sigma factor (sigma-70 family)